MPNETVAASLFYDLSLRIAQQGSGPAAMILHGGGGPATVTDLATHLAENYRTILPTHPGWDGTSRPDWVAGIDDLAMVYLRYLKQEGHRNVVLVGSSIGGWLAAEMAIRDTGNLVGAIVLVNPIGISVPRETIADIFSMTPREMAELAFHQPDQFFIDPAGLPAETQAVQMKNRDALRQIAGNPYMHDPKLVARFRFVDVPSVVIWGESDRIVGSAYGRAYAQALPRGRFAMITRAGHLPHIEKPDATFAAIDGFLASNASAPAPN